MTGQNMTRQTMKRQILTEQNMKRQTNKGKTSRRLRFVFALLLALPALAAAQTPVPDILRTMVDSISEINLVRHVRRLEEAGGHWTRVRHTAGSDSGAAYILRELRALPGLTSITVDSFTMGAKPGATTRMQRNIIATIPGSQQPERILVIGAHHDCSASRMGSSIWSSQWQTLRAPGADDNATGVAILLELARLFSDPASGFKPVWTIRLIAFAAEETNPADYVSHAGSRRLARLYRRENVDIAGMISVDMVGFNTVADFQSIICDEASEPLARKFLAAKDSLNIDLVLGLKKDPASTYSDHEPFWSELFPAVCLIEYAPPWNSGAWYTANPFYHTSADSSATVNFRQVRKVAQLTLAAAGMMTAPVTAAAPVADMAQPQQLALEQNYPNPFNPVTTIRYELPAAGEVQLTVHDRTGREVARPVAGFRPAGVHTLRFDAAHLPSGLYFYTLRSGSFTTTRKMVKVQ